MKNALKKLVAVYFIFIAYFIVQKCLFMAFYDNVIGMTLGDVWPVIRHGWDMDCSIAAYLSAIPAICFICELWISHRWLEVTLRCYFGLISVLLGIITVLDITLYGYWGFRLDMTPLFYFSTSPAAAMASAEWWQLPVGVTAIAILAVVLYKSLYKTVGSIAIDRKRRGFSTAVMTIITAALFIPARGGVTVSTMNLSRSYFSQNQRLNHAALNPAFTLLYSATHQNNFKKQYRFLEPTEASAAISALNHINTDIEPADSTCTPLLNNRRPEIYLIILESFSSHLMPSLGGEAITINLDSLAREGVLFTNFYANSFRTDRALPAILSGFPSQPSTSIMKFVEKAENLPSIAESLKNTGYEPHYYYGGDINFTNMAAYLVNSGFESIVCDKDFSLSQRASKWGAPDHLVFERALADAVSNKAGHAPRFNVIQTSSSHEPFEVPYSNPRFADEPRKNAFAYTDSCLMAFVNGLKSLSSYRNTLLVIVPDHLGAWPKDLPAATSRHHVPLIFAGGALNRTGLTIGTPASQNDIAATLLSALGVDHTEFRFSNDILHPSSPHYAVFAEPSLAGIVTPTDTVTINCDSGEIIDASGPHATERATQIKAYLQTLYDYIDAL